MGNENNQALSLLADDRPQTLNVWTNMSAFENAQRVCKLLASSSIVPQNYKNNLPDTLVAYDIAARTGMSPIMVMQNLDIIQGRPAWNSKFVIAAITSCGRFRDLRYKMGDEGQKDVQYSYTEYVQGNKQRKQATINIRNLTCFAYAVDNRGEVIEGPKVSIEMAVKEGWYTKNDSKWPNMPELMLRYRAAKFFGNLYAPDILLGMATTDELQDAQVIETTAITAHSHSQGAYNPIEVLNNSLAEEPENFEKDAIDLTSDELM